MRYFRNTAVESDFDAGHMHWAETSRPERAPRDERGPRLLPHAPEELTRGRLRRLGEGIGKVIYASEHWVVKRERSASEIIALIMIWKLLRRLERILPVGFGRRLLERPSKQLRLLRLFMQAAVAVVPKSVWFMTHVGEAWTVYRTRDRRGETLAQERLMGTRLIPERVTFPPTLVKVSGWPGWLEVSEATERVEATLYQRLKELARASRFDELERWLDRLLDLRQAGWQRGLFSVDAHLKNFGVVGERVVLIDTGGLTDDWADVEERMCFEDSVTEPHIQLGLGSILGSRPDIAGRFNARWKRVVNRDQVRRHWPERAETAGSRRAPGKKEPVEFQRRSAAENH
ncbi:MAG: hypothetical protein HYZ57_06370 [Acidobacteria bacterium]|nr:hypothetical protein [Acidobacteriota bacterium]